MVLQKCKECGGVIFKKGPLKYACRTCGKEYESDYAESYKERGDFVTRCFHEVRKLLDDNKTGEASTAVSNYLEPYSSCDEDEKFYIGYEVEMILGCWGMYRVDEVKESFISYPEETNVAVGFADVVVKCRDAFYSVSKKNESFISYRWLMGYFGNYITSIVMQAINEISDKWKKYDHEDDSSGWHEYIAALINCRTILDSLDEYGDVCLDSAYQQLIEMDKTGLNLTYPHRYWDLYDRLATQNIGLSYEAKEIWKKELEEHKRKLQAFENRKNELEERHRKEEEARLEAEKRVRIQKYWENNQELKKSLLSEKEELLSRVSELEAKKDKTNADKEIADLKEEIQIANMTLSSLGFFAMKEKKAKKQQIEQLTREIYLQKERVEKIKKEIQTEIDSVQTRIEKIDSEFKADRP